jgi:pyruvate/2-oxoacid:ferredoxin oxidoreductase beta subunit
MERHVPSAAGHSIHAAHKPVKTGMRAPYRKDRKERSSVQLIAGVATMLGILSGVLWLLS